MSTRLNVALVAEFDLCEKLAETLEQSCLEIEKLSVVELFPFAEEQGIRFNNKIVAQLSLDETEWSDFDYVFFAGELTHATHIAKAASAGCMVIDLKGICATLNDVPVIVPSVNNEQLLSLQRNIVSLPDPQVTQFILFVSQLAREANLSQVLVTSLLPASYIDSETVSKLAGQTAQLLNGIPLDEEQQRLAFDVFPSTKHTVNLAAQVEKIFPQLPNVIFHQVQVPVFYGMAQTVTLLSDYELDMQSQISAWQGNELVDFNEAQLFTPVTNGEAEAGETAKLHIGGLTVVENGVQFWLVADEQRFDIALLGVKLAELVYQKGY
ncbi:oxidoreductase [Aggregatibacter aphrophilus]|uniref:oxidoreductase n=1 Tax=Aggregatibacter aphrophilus TaxID=732 RepID=UPI000DA3F3C2|nr:oxidoreductase [Aggregatibacter aphrophilus]RDE92792.1 oxidoreductase [Aggregatibacter aphrophilus]SQI98873.1 USG-1 protein [Aggregatibacter aphrophilus]